MLTIAQQLHHVVGGVHEHEDVPTVKVLPDGVVHYAAQHVESFPHVSRLRIKPEPRPVTQAEHGVTNLSGCQVHSTYASSRSTGS